MQPSLLGKIAAITGATSGIGLECAKSFLNAGAKVVLIHYSEEKLNAVCDVLGANAIPLVIDVTCPASVKTMMPSILEKVGGLDIFHANAGSYVGGVFVEGDPDAWDKMLDINVNAVFRSVHAVLPHMIEQKHGDIIITGSIAGVIPTVGEPIYSASKHAVQAFAHAVRRQVSKHGVRVGSVLPGPVVTKLLDDWPAKNLEAVVASGALMDSVEVADCVMFMVTRNPKVTIRDIVVLPNTVDL
jgi:ribitol 2-dehydrogenase